MSFLLLTYEQSSKLTNRELLVINNENERFWKYLFQSLVVFRLPKCHKVADALDGCPYSAGIKELINYYILVLVIILCIFSE